MLVLVQKIESTGKRTKVTVNNSGAQYLYLHRRRFMKRYLPMVLLALGVSCQPKSNQVEVELSQAEKLIYSNCSTCHGLGDEELNSAPNLNTVRKAWLEAFPEENEFIENMASFLGQPKIENSQMPEAIERFGIMPKMGYTDEQTEELARWLYHNKVEEQLQEAVNQEKDALELGRSIALATKAALGKQLMTQLKQNGAVKAISFCQTKALPITDSVSTAFGAEVRRISNKPRNELNQADSDEIALLNSWIEELKRGEKPQAVLIEKKDHSVGYYPIFTEEKCMACHGSPNRAVQQKIDELYPKDLAVGYAPNQLRGAFRVQLKKQ